MKQGLWLLALALFLPFVTRAEDASATQATVTFNKDIAPIIYRSCAPCHHRGEATPFELIRYADVAKRAQQILDVTSDAYMPPCPPITGHGYPKLIGARSLNDNDLELIRRWVSEGAKEGAPADLPPAPQWTSEWQLGPPDLVVEMAKTYNLPVDGKDIYRNFVIQSPVQERRYVRAIEFRPESRAAHHVFIETDHSHQSRLKEAAQQTPGFPGEMPEGPEMPAGQFLTWQPGKKASISPAGMPWVLDQGTDLVLEAHMRPTGRIEPIRFKVGLYFTNQPPQRAAYRLVLTSLMVDIPPDATNFVVERSFTLPVDCEALAVLPHCHLLGREVEGHADLPDGSRQPLILITNWDFNWQGDYRFQKPVKLPRGSTLRMQITYDNSTNNPRNPNHPPKRVQYGSQFTDEMAELSFLLLPERAEDEKALYTADQKSKFDMGVLRNEEDVRENPTNAEARVKLGGILLAQRKTDEARKQIERALELDSNFERAHYFAGLVARLQKRLPDAEREFQTCLRLDASDAKAWGNLGFVQIGLGDVKAARQSLQHAVEINPSDQLSRNALDQINK
ncbi:MAG TPA: tetratricopeptide repeat protein [Verrucomicrobiae bacterium]|jgi:hypothetical protein